ncbi:hypothetical protein L1987_69124 [Smallanthus sonchifolius]|uniref:Uncharacterized protein n=1 Tax=Smallanthus sonchifolius TaxID=185202 RepID=A0ACB9B4Y0_9ASTR|nr:hypothetical protein L1987_69124 [Smallanthus sonchifolius]
MYHGTTSTSKSSGSGIAIFTGNPTKEDHSTGCGGHACYASGSGLGSHHQNTSRNPPATSSANQSAIARIAKDHVALFSSCMLAYENFIGGKLTDPETIEEDFNQVDPDDIEDMDIQWNMDMLLRKAKCFLNRTGRKFIGGHPNAKKDRAPTFGFTRPRQGNNHGHNNPNHHNQSQGGTSNALVAQQDDNFDWGVYLEDAIIAQTQVGLMAEIMEMLDAEKREASMADVEESTAAATEKVKEAEEKEASVADEEESTTVGALMAIGEATRSSSEVDSNPFSVISCSKCLGLKLENSRLQEKIEPLSLAALNYKENEKRFKDSIETLKKEKCEYSLKISDQQLHLDVAYRGLEKRNNEINKLQNEILQLKCTNEKLKNSRFVVEHYESIVRQLNGLGLGTNAIPPPVSGKFVNSLIDIDLTCLDECSDKDDSPKKDESSSKANSTSSEEFVTASEDGSVNSCPEGVVSEELLTEQKVKKNVITNGDNCILTEPDIIERNDNLKVMLYVGYESLNQAKKEAFSAHYGLGYKENLEKYYTPINQTVKVQTNVHKPTPPSHNAELSKARSNEPYKRTYVDKRNCFHCGLVGHIFVNCPSKNEGKRPVVSQPAFIPRSPPVKPSPKHPKQNVVKPPVKPMVKPKIMSEAKPSVTRKVTQHAVPRVSTSGSTRTGEKPVARLSKPQRRRRNKRLRKLEQLTPVHSGEASTSSPAVVEPKSPVPVKKQKRSWTAKSKTSQSPSSISSKDSSILNGHHDCELKEVVYFEKDGRPKTTMAWVSELKEGCPKGTISNRWYVDSGCSRHMTGNMALLQDVKPFRGGYVAFAGEKGGSITCQGVVSNGCVSFDNVNFCEQLKHNLLSVSQMCDKEYSVMFDKLECLILKTGFEVPEYWILMRAPRTNDTYKIDMSVATTTSSVPTYLLTKATELDSILWHKKLGHISHHDCMPCKKGKQQRKSHKPKLKDETADILQYLILSLESLCKLKVRRIRSDNGTEFKNNLMELFCLKKGIRHEFSVPYTPQHNGVAERKKRTLIETVRTMLSDVKLPVTFWAEAVNTACRVLNRVLVYKDRLSKFHPKAVEGIFLGYVANSPCKRVYNIGTPTVEEWFEVDCSKHSIPPERTGPAWGFDYDALFKSFILPDLSAVDAANVYELLGGGDDSSFSTRATVPIITLDSNAASGTHESDDSEDVLVVGDDAQANPNTTVGNEAPADPINIESSSSRTQEMGELSTNLDPEIQEPNVPETTVHRNHPIDNIIGDPYAGVLTRHLTITENTSLYTEILDTGVMETCLHLHVWDLVDLPKGFQPIGTRWVFKCKTDDRHVVVKNKARLVVQGFYQQEGLDYTKVYAPVARIEAIRLFLAYATYVGFKVYQLDVKSAFLYGKVHEEVYVTQPPGFEDLHNINKVYKLDKAHYGLHQAPRAWYETLSQHLLSNGFDRGEIDSTLFIRKAGGDILLVQVYVEDIIFGSTNEGMCREFEQDILSKYKMNDSSTYGTPIPVNHGLHPDKDGKDVDSRLYHGMIRSLMYLTASRPDIMFAVCLCSRFQSQPKESHMIAVKKIFRYLKGKPRLGLWLVSWQCKKQSTVSVSTCEVEYIAAASGFSQAFDRSRFEHLVNLIGMFNPE